MGQGRRMCGQLLHTRTLHATLHTHVPCTRTAPAHTQILHTRGPCTLTAPAHTQTLHTRGPCTHTAPAHTQTLHTRGPCTRTAPAHTQILHTHRPCTHGLPAYSHGAGPTSCTMQSQTRPLKTGHTLGAHRSPKKCWSPGEVQAEEA